MRNCFLRLIGRVVLVGFLVGTPTGCSVFKKGEGKRTEKKGESDPDKEGKKTEPEPVRIVGEIISVHSEEGFVLIRRHAQGGGFGKGNIIASVSPEGKTASLVLTGERLGKYHAADVQEGTPAKGDLVVSRRMPEGTIAPSTPVPQAPEGDSEAPWMKNFPQPSL